MSEQIDTNENGPLLRDPSPRQRRKRLIRWGLCPCSRCGRVVSLAHMETKTDGQIGSHCLDCKRERQRESYQRRKERQQAQQAVTSTDEQKTTKTMGPRQRKAQLALLGLGECCRCRRILPLDLFARRTEDRPETRCKACEASRQRERRQSRPLEAPPGMTPLAAPRLTAPVGGADYAEAVAKAKAVLAGTRRGA
jgi:hypothetical protein